MANIAHPSSPAKTAIRRRLALWVTKAERHRQKSEFSQAMKMIDAVLAEDADHIGAMEVAAKALWSLQNFEALEVLMTRMIHLNPFEPGYHSLRGMALRAMGQYGEAAKELSRDPNAQKALEDLEGFQANLIRDILAQDPAFSAAYAKDPAEALRERGFHFEARDAAFAWVAANEITVSAFARPA